MLALQSPTTPSRKTPTQEASVRRLCLTHNVKHVVSSDDRLQTAVHLHFISPSTMSLLLGISKNAGNGPRVPASAPAARIVSSPCGESSPSFHQGYYPRDIPISSEALLNSKAFTGQDMRLTRPALDPTTEYQSYSSVPTPSLGRGYWGSSTTHDFFLPTYFCTIGNKREQQQTSIIPKPHAVGVLDPEILQIGSSSLLP